jgi:hypothetical protein
MESDKEEGSDIGAALRWAGPREGGPVGARAEVKAGAAEHGCVLSTLIYLHADCGDFRPQRRRRSSLEVLDMPARSTS